MTTRPTTPGRLSMRQRRLQSDSDQIRRTFSGFDPIRLLDSRGAPPEIYRIEFHINGIESLGPGGQPIFRDTHVAELRLTSEYPRMAPHGRMITPVFHPNIDAASICVGDHWAAGERLVDFVVRIGELLAYQAYNIRSPLNAEAAMWADLHLSELPTDGRDLHPPEE